MRVNLVEKDRQKIRKHVSEIKAEREIGINFKPELLEALDNYATECAHFGEKYPSAHNLDEHAMVSIIF